MPKHIDTLILSLLSHCNLRCEYCHNDIYYSSLPAPVEMPRDLAKKSVRDYARYLKSVGLLRGTVCMSGGEPLLIGLEYMDDILSTIRRCAEDNGIDLHVNVQTNGTLIDDSWCDCFVRHNIGVGLSVDGFPHLTDKHRRVADGFRRTSECVSMSAKALISKGLSFGVLFVVTASSIGQEAEILQYLQSLGPETIAFTPCLDKGPVISSSAYATFVTRFWDAWINSGRIDPEVRMFKYCRQRITNSVQMPIPCEWGNDCPNTICVSADGKLWVCDVFMGNDRGYLGDMIIQSLAEVVQSSKFNQFIEQRSILPRECLVCEAIEVCGGGCPYRRAGEKKDCLCEATLAIYRHMHAFISGTVEGLKDRKNQRVEQSERFIRDC